MQPIELQCQIRADQQSKDERQLQCLNGQAANT
jgi:hypothetical protein